MTAETDQPDWYCDEVLPGRADNEIVAADEHALAFRPDRRTPGVNVVASTTGEHLSVGW